MTCNVKEQISSFIMEAEDINENKFHKRFKFFIFITRLGAVPLFMEKKPLYYKVYEVIALLMGYSCMVVTFLDAACNNEDIQRTMGSLRICIPSCMIIWLQTILRVQKHAVEDLLHATDSFTWEDLPTQTLDGHLTNAGLIPVTEKLLKCFIPFIWGIHTLQSLVRVIFAHDMVFDSWYPFDVTESPIYEIVNLIQLLGSMVLQSIFTAFLGLYATVIEISCSQIEKLKISLKNIGEQDIHKELIQCIRHHQQVLKYVREIEEAFSWCVAGIFLINIISLCVIAFSAVQSWHDAVALVQIVVIYITMLLQNWVICSLGEELMQQASSVGEAVYAVDWVGQSVPFQRHISFMIANTNSGLKQLSAARFVPVSKGTFMKFMNETMSLFMFLLQVQERDDGK